MSKIMKKTFFLRILKNKKNIQIFPKYTYINMILSTFIIFPDYLHVYHPDLNRLATDSAALLTVVGNAIRCPAHIFSNSEIRTQFRIMLCGEREKKVRAF